MSTGSAAVGAALSGLLARGAGITAPFWTSFAVMVVLTAVAWRLFTADRLAAEPQTTREEAAGTR